MLVIAGGAAAEDPPAPPGGPDLPPAALAEELEAAAATEEPTTSPTVGAASSPTVESTASPTVQTTASPAVEVASAQPVADADTGATSVSSGTPTSALACVAPTDGAAIDLILAEAGSPLAGDGATFVEAASAVDLDPRALVAIAAHETILATYGPSQAIHNPFGLGPGMSFATYADAIRFAASTLRDGYLDEGRLTLGPIGSKWAPVGATNDPGNLNAAWEAGVGGYYERLGGDPEREVLLSVQGAGDLCDTSAPASSPADPQAAEPESPEPTGPPVVTAWDGSAPRSGRGPEHGAAADGEPATLEGFVFPLALPIGQPVDYVDGFRDPGGPGCLGQAWRCSIVLEPGAGAAVVASAAGRLEAAVPDEVASGVVFWIVTPDGERIGYGPLGAYADGIQPGAEVQAGQVLGASSDRLVLTWERDGTRINPYPLLAATRPPAGT